eukprot:1463168-Pyramimonas_sp.AAC.1
MGRGTGNLGQSQGAYAPGTSSGPGAPPDAPPAAHGEAGRDTVSGDGALGEVSPVVGLFFFAGVIQSV